MAYETLELLIDGGFRAGAEGKSEPVLNPATDDALAHVPHAAQSDLDDALAACARGFEAWRDVPARDRQKIMEEAARLLEERSESIARNLTLEMGKPLGEAKMELGFAIDVLRWYGEEGKRAYGREIPARVPGMRQVARKEPIGPALAFVAWNFPAVNVMRKVAAALGAGCSIIIKPSEETPATAVAIGRALQDAGLPPGVLNIVFGVPAEVSEYLLASDIPRKVSFTGSVAVGRHLQILAARTLKRCTMELGGHAPFLVFDDADVGKAAVQAAAGKFRNAGQVCVSPTRFLVHDSVYDAFTERFVEETQKIVVGNGLDEGTGMGPLVSQRRLEAIQAMAEEAEGQGATLLTGGARIGNQGAFFEPTIIEGAPMAAQVRNEEPFGPIAVLNRFGDADEMLAEGNRLRFGLAAYAFTRDPARAEQLADRLNSGLLAINSLMVSTPETPFGGMLDSGYGSEGGIEGLEAFLQTRLVTYTH